LAAVPRAARHTELEPRFLGLDGSGAVLDGLMRFFRWKPLIILRNLAWKRARRGVEWRMRGVAGAFFYCGELIFLQAAA
jgi:hypothetical protein